MEKIKFEHVEKDLPHPEVEKIECDNGFIYEMYFTNEEEAQRVITAFWNLRSPMAANGVKSGMLRAAQHEITFGDRTSPRSANSSDLAKHPSKTIVVQFNGNTRALKPAGEEILRKLGLIE